MNKLSRFHKLMACVLLMVGPIAFADTLYLRDGEQAQGSLKAMTPDTVVFDGVEGEIRLEKSDVSRIQLQRVRQWDDVTQAEQISDADLKAVLANQPAADDFPADGFVTLLDRFTFDLTEPGVIKATQRTISKVLRQRGEEVATVNVLYFEDTAKAEIDFALTVTPDGRVLRLSDAAVKEESLFAGVPGYRRLSRLRFAAKEPRPGSVIDVQRTVTRTRVPVVEPFYVELMFREPAPIVRKEVMVIVPADAEETVAWQLDIPENGVFKTVTTLGEAGPVAATRRVEGENVVLTWTLTQPQPGISDAPLMPPVQTFVPKLTLGEAQSWETLAEAYAAKLADVAPVSEALKSKAVELAAQGGAGAIHDFVARNVRLAPVPIFAYSLVPRPGDETLRLGMGNELDKNFLYYQMLEAAGVPCSFALLRDRSEGPACLGVASLRGFSHGGVYLEKERTFSDASIDVLPFGVLPGLLQGGWALPVTADAEPVRIEEASLKDEPQTVEFDARLDTEGNLSMTVTLRACGNQAAPFRGLKTLSDQDVRVQLQQLVSDNHPGGILNSYTTTDLADLSVPPVITLECTVPGYGVTAGDDLMMFNVPLTGFSAEEVGRPDRELGLFWNNKMRQRIEGVIHLPAGFRVYSMPQKVAFKSSVADYKVRFKKAASKLEFRQTYDLKVSSAPASAYSDYKQSLELRADLARQRIILMRAQ